MLARARGRAARRRGAPARARCGDLRARARRPRASEDEALFRTVLLGLLISTAEACGGFDWDDEAFETAYAELEHSLFGERRTYVAIAPLVGHLAREAGRARARPRRAAVRRRRARDALARVARAASARLRPRAGSLVRRSSSGSELDAASAPPDAAAEIADAVSALRLDDAGRVAAGPVMFETLDGRPFGIQPVLPIAATQPPGEPSRLDAFRAPIAVDVLAALGDADGDPELADALDRWELSLFQSEPFRARAAPRRAARRSSARRGRCAAASCWRGRGVARGALRRADRARRGRRGDAGARSTPRAARSSPSCARATATASRTSSTASCSGSAAARAARDRRRSRRRSFGSKPLPGRERGAATVEPWTSREPFSSGSSGSRRSTGGGAAGRARRRARALLVEAEAWSRREGGEAGDERAVDGPRADGVSTERDMIAM